MSFRLLSLAATVLGLVSSSLGQFPPPAEYTNILQSPLDPKIKVAYKTPDVGTCATIFSTQKQFTGYVSLPPETLAPIRQNYSINTFFWFIEARQQPEIAPLTIWLNGGPGSSSLIGLFTENGPCEVVETNDGGYGTQSRLWGWDRSSNILYIDQPVQVGLSYDAVTNASYDLLRDEIIEPARAASGSAPAYTFLNGSFSSQISSSSANTSQIAARSVWHFLQTFLHAFPEYNPGIRPNDTTIHPTGINLFTESYGGFYGPVFADHFEQQNDLLRVGQLPAESVLEIELSSLGIINGMIDWRTQAAFYPMFAANNSYNIKAIDTATMDSALVSIHRPDGCLDQLDQCRNLQDTQDYAGEGDVELVNTRCSRAFAKCADLTGLLASSNRNVYDIRQKDPSPFPSAAYIEYLNTAQVQKAIGVPVNYTENNVVADSFYSTGDPLRGAQVPALGRLLARGIRVALIYGDADFICNWQGGEAVSLNLATMLPAYSIPFPSAGYAAIVVNSSYVGGVVRQFGNLSFARIYDAGHLVPAYQPETAFTVFTRVIQGTSISMGQNVNLSSYNTFGPPLATFQNKASAFTSQDSVCWIRSIKNTCTSEERTQILAGEGVVRGGVWYAEEGNYKPPSSSVAAGIPGRPAPNATQIFGSGTSSVAPTGVYTATGTPVSGGCRQADGKTLALSILIAITVVKFCY